MLGYTNFQGVYNPQKVSIKIPMINIQSTDIRLSFVAETLILAIFGTEIKAHRSDKVIGCNGTDRKATRDIEYTSKLEQNHLKPRLLFT